MKKNYFQIHAKDNLVLAEANLKKKNQIALIYILLNPDIFLNKSSPDWLDSPITD